jgi:septum formation protein
MKILFLGSSSAIRQQLLKEMGINFHAVSHQAREESCYWGLPLEQLAPTIALAKMESLLLPKNLQDGTYFVLTADSIAADQHGRLYAKPADRADAVQMIKALRGSGRVATAFCLDKKQLKNGSWQNEVRILKTAIAAYEFHMPDDWINRYLDATPHYQSICGGLTIEGFGAQFLQSVDGSYSTILGLPVYQVREALEQLGFYLD